MSHSPNGDNVMVNATQMAKVFGKRPNDWLKTEQAQRMIEAIAKTNIFGLADNQLVVTKKGGQSNLGLSAFRL